MAEILQNAVQNAIEEQGEMEDKKSKKAPAVGRTLSLHYYYLAFVVLTYLAYLIAVVNTSYRSSLVLQTWAYKPLVALD
jgi:hypothetical protein